MKTYSELLTFNTFEARFEYLRLDGVVGSETFSNHRHLNQTLYRSNRWRTLRRQIIIRDGGCDLGVVGHDVTTKILVHHINPLRVDDLVNNTRHVFDPDNLICVSHDTHQALHYGLTVPTSNVITIRRPGDTTPWIKPEE